MVASGTDEAGRPISIHERRAMKEDGLAAQLHYDPYERRSGLVRILAPGTDAAAWASGQAVELGDAVDGGYAIETLELDRLVVSRDAVVGPAGAHVDVRKELVLGGDRGSPTLTLGLTVTNRSAAAIEAKLGLEWTLMFLGGGANPAAWWEVDGRRTSHDSGGTAHAVRALAQGNDYVGISLATTVSEPADAWWAPVETISNSESGFERVYQGAGLLLSWPLSLGPGENRTVSVNQVVTTAHDRTAEELAAMAGPSPSTRS
jgi:alpha-amylase